jgi:hypothetical protein
MIALPIDMDVLLFHVLITGMFLCLVVGLALVVISNDARKESEEAMTPQEEKQFDLLEVSYDTHPRPLK